MSTTIEVGTDFSRTPGGRFISDGPYSGELFRDSYLLPALERASRDADKVVVILDGPRGYLSSFLEEAFGGLVRVRGYTHDQLNRLLEIRVNDAFYATYKSIAARAILEARQVVAA